MRPKKRHLKFYKDCMEKGEIPKAGLCNCATNNKYINKKLFDLVTPTSVEELSSGYQYLLNTDMEVVNKNWPWGYDGEILRYSELPPNSKDSIMYTFSPLRQTLVLLMAAMNGEL